ncbi:UNVERIFIED_CONTAM: hypothetical protein GTU68_043200 [Idotea baltica]|nr:hypothetical protein [Idotea baltica]
MTAARVVPVDDAITIAQLTSDPYPIYAKCRAENPVLKVSAVGRILLTKAADTRYVKLHPEVFSSDDPNTPMERAFEAKTLMRRDGNDHNRLRSAMMPAMSPQIVKQSWAARIDKICDQYIDRLPAGETVDFFTAFAGPFAARCVAEVLGIPKASDDDIQRWSQALIDGAGNFAGLPEPFAKAQIANREINACIENAVEVCKGTDMRNALAVQVNALEPIEMEHIISNIKIAIGGGINEPRDALMTVLFGLLTNPEQKSAVTSNGELWLNAFEEAVRWVAPIQVSSRLVKEDTNIRGFDIPAGEVVMTIQASANRDEEVFDNGHLFDISRKTTRHQGFGSGPHFCMGTHLSRRMLADVALPKLFERFPNMDLASPEKVVWSGFGFRGPLNLPLTLK